MHLQAVRYWYNAVFLKKIICNFSFTAEIGVSFIGLGVVFLGFSYSKIPTPCPTNQNYKLTIYMGQGGRLS